MTNQVIPLWTGSFSVRFHPEVEKYYRVKVQNVPAMVYAIVSPDDAITLVDTGFSPEYIPAYEYEYHLEGSLQQVVERAGLKWDNITDVVMTHTHWDHTGNLPLLKEQQIWLQAMELDYMLHMPTYREPAWHPSHWVPVFDHIRLIHGDQEIKPGVKLLYTGGHTPGHQAVQVHTEAGIIMLVGDAPFDFEDMWEITDRVMQDNARLYQHLSWLEGDMVRDKVEGLLKCQGYQDLKPLPERNSKDLRRLADKCWHGHDPRLVK